MLLFEAKGMFTGGTARSKKKKKKFKNAGFDNRVHFLHPSPHPAAIIIKKD
jgi:hypothetical protein